MHEALDEREVDIRDVGVCRLIFETNVSKALYFQGVETQALSTRGQADVNLHRLTAIPRESTERTDWDDVILSVASVYAAAAAAM